MSLIFTPTKGEAEEVRGDLWQISVWGRSQSIFSGSSRLPQWLIIWNRVADFRQHGIQLNLSDCPLSINSTLNTRRELSTGGQVWLLLCFLAGLLEKSSCMMFVRKGHGDHDQLEIWLVSQSWTKDSFSYTCWCWCNQKIISHEQIFQLDPLMSSLCLSSQPVSLWNHTLPLASKSSLWHQAWLVSNNNSARSSFNHFDVFFSGIYCGSNHFVLSSFLP